jgi:hypothetical protein
LRTIDRIPLSIRWPLISTVSLACVLMSDRLGEGLRGSGGR